MKRLAEILQLAADHLEQKNVAHSRRQAEDLLSEALGIPRLQLYLDHDKPLTEEELARCRIVIARRAAREPTAYIAGKVVFLECTIEVTPDVLIPRPETEILADTIRLEQGTLLDLCCGSGCIGIALKKRFPHLRVLLSDISPEALAVAKRNAKRNGVEVECLQGDLLSALNEKVDGVVCNPPYVSDSEYATLEPEVHAEPKKAHLGGVDGLDFYRRLAKELPSHLNRGAKVWLEIGSTQGEAVKKIFNDSCWTKAALAQDWSGHDRFFSLEFE